jgi:hypothetical protein
MVFAEFPEMGHTQWQVCFPVPRTRKHITLVRCIAADGSFLKPLNIISRKTCGLDFALTSRVDKKVAGNSQTKGWIDQPLVVPELTDIFLLEAHTDAKCRVAPDIRF